MTNDEYQHGSEPFDIICLSHLRWDFVYQRPQHLLSRFARERRVFFIEEPVSSTGPEQLSVSKREDELYVVVPHLLPETIEQNWVGAQRELLDQLIAEHNIQHYVLWYYTPMSLSFSRHLEPLAIVYDCMDELSAFAGAPKVLQDRERELFGRADLVFTGGQSLYEAKRTQHPNVHAFPSSVDVAHFAQARQPQAEPADQAPISHPRLGFFGVIDERMDRQLLDEIAAARPDWQLVILGPVAKIEPEDLPRRPNIHYLGSKAYTELPTYLSGWDVALLPFARNRSTQFISPTKTPEYLAAGKPVVSTSIRDVVRPYGERGLVRIADTAVEFVNAVEAALVEDAATRQAHVDTFLQQMSWDRTWAEMRRLINEAVSERQPAAADSTVSE